MPRAPLGRPARYEDIVDTPDHLVAEIVDDKLWTSPRPSPKHARAHTSFHARGEVVRAEPLDAVDLALMLLWDEPPGLTSERC